MISRMLFERKASFDAGFEKSEHGLQRASFRDRCKKKIKDKNSSSPYYRSVAPHNHINGSPPQQRDSPIICTIMNQTQNTVTFFLALAPTLPFPNRITADRNVRTAVQHRCLLRTSTYGASARRHKLPSMRLVHKRHRFLELLGSRNTEHVHSQHGRNRH